MKPGPTENTITQKKPHVIPSDIEELPYNGATVGIPITHRYNILSSTDHMQNITTLNNPHTVFPKERKKVKYFTNRKIMTYI